MSGASGRTTTRRQSSRRTCAESSVCGWPPDLVARAVLLIFQDPVVLQADPVLRPTSLGHVRVGLVAAVGQPEIVGAIGAVVAAIVVLVVPEAPGLPSGAQRRRVPARSVEVG